MAIRATCPGCRSVNTYADPFAGKTVRCKNCRETFVVVAEKTSAVEAPARMEAIRSGESQATPGTSPETAAPTWEQSQTPIPTKEREAKSKSLTDTDVQDTIQEKEAPPTPPAPRVERTTPSPRQHRDNGRDWPRPRRRANRGPRIGLIAAAVLILLVGGGVAVWWFWYSPFAGNPAQNKGSPQSVDVNGPWPHPQAIDAPANIVVTVRVAGVTDEFTRDAAFDRLDDLLHSSGAKSPLMNHLGSGDRMTVLLAPIEDVKAFAEKLDFGTVRSVDKRTITVVAQKVNGPAFNADPAAKALFRLKSVTARRRAQGARALKEPLKDLASHDLRYEIVRTLESLLNDPDRNVRQEVILALGVWGTKDTVPLLLKTMSDKDTRKSVIIALGRLKDERAAEPIAERLEDSAEPREAIEALKKIGPAAEPAVLARLNHPAGQVRMNACDILKQIGTKQSIPALEKLAAARDFIVSDKAKEAIQAINARNG